MEPFTLTLFTFLIIPVYGGFGPPVSREQLYRQLYGNPCDCPGGTVPSGYLRAHTEEPAPQGQVDLAYLASTDCGNKVAYLAYNPNIKGGFGLGIDETQWTCTNKPRIIPPIAGLPPPCPSECSYVDQMHSSCYTTTQICTGSDNQTYLTAMLLRRRSATFGGDWDSTSLSDNNKYSQAGCSGTIGNKVCWPTKMPVYISDGGGPNDILKETLVTEHIQKILHHLFPPLTYHPLALPKSRDMDLDTQTNNILESTFWALNHSNPSLAQDCWLCMTMGTPIPTAIPSNITVNTQISNCSRLSLPLRVQPVGFNTSPCYQGRFQNNTFDVDLGFVTFTNCSDIIQVNGTLCSSPGQVFICGNSLAYTTLPTNWTGLCVSASLLPDISIIPGDTPVPLPSLEFATGRHKRAITAIPLLVGLGITAGIASGTAGVGVAVQSYNKLSRQLIDDVQTLSGTINDLQDQIDSLAEVVLQNRRGLDLLTAEQGGICLALQERCCFYANKSGIVRDKIKKLQEDLVKRRKELFENPLWTGLNGLLPYLLPTLGPLLCILLLIAFGPWAFRRITDLIKNQIDAVLAKPIQIHYQRLATGDGLEEGYLGFLPTGTT